MSWFTPLSDPGGAGPHVVQSEAVARIRAAATGPGFSIVTGAAGTGKTTAANFVAHGHAGRVVRRNVGQHEGLRAVIDDVRSELGTVLAGDLIILDDFGDMRPPPSPAELRDLGTVGQFGGAHVVMTMREAAAAVMAARLATAGETFPPRWSLTDEPGSLIQMTWSPADLDEVLRRTGDSERAEVVRQLLGQAATPDDLLRLAASFIAESSDNIGRPDLLLVPDASGHLRVESATQLPVASVRLGQDAPIRATPWVLLQRSRGVWLPAADALEEIINDPGVREQDLQDFFEANPHLLSRDSYSRVIPHPVLSQEDGNLIPDFMLEPEALDPVGIVELKLPGERIVAGGGKRLRPAAGVASAIAQVREYRAHFEHPDARAEFRDRYGIDAYQPGAAILIGRDTAVADPLQLRRLWNDLPGGVQVHTYDDLLRKIRRLGSY